MLPLILEDKDSIGYGSTGVLSLTNNGEILAERYIFGRVGELFTAEEKEFYKNNPDVLDEWNEQSKQFNELQEQLLNDIEYMFAPREDQMEEFGVAVKFIKEKMYDQYLDAAG